jgi:O-antigen/teichoic acid export membrane protein
LDYFKNSENARSFVYYGIIESILSAIFSMVLVVYLRIGVMGLVLGPLAANAIIFTILTLRFISFLPVSFDWRILKFSLKLSYPLTPSVFAKVISTQFDKYMIGLLSSIGGVGIYSIGQRVAYLVFTFMTAVQNVFMPQVYKMMFELDDEGGRAVGNYLTPFAYVCIGIGLAIALFSEEVIHILTPQSYHGAINIVTILCMFYGSLFFAKQPQLIFAKKTFVNTLLTVVSIFLNIGLNIPFIIKWGAIGAAWATLLAGLLSGVILFFVSQYYYEIEWEYKKLCTIFCAFFGSSVLVIFLRQIAVAYYITLLVKLLLVSAYIYIGIIIKVVSSDNLSLLKNLFLNLRFGKVEESAT